MPGADRSRHRVLRSGKPRVRALSRGRGYRSQPNESQEPANQWHLRAFPSHAARRVLPRRVPQKDLSHARRAADRSGWLADRVQREADTSGPLLLRQDADADLPSRTTLIEGEADGRLITNDRSNRPNNQQRLSDRILAYTTDGRVASVARPPRLCSRVFRHQQEKGGRTGSDRLCR